MNIVMTRKERVKRAIAHQEADLVPWHFDLTTIVVRKLARHFGIQPEYWEVEEQIGGHLKPVGVRPAAGFQPIDRGDDCWQDEFGAVWKRGESTRDTGDWGGHIDHPLKTDSLDGYRFPDPYAAGRLDHIAEHVANNPDRFISFAVRGIFDFGWHLRGFENLMMDFAGNPRFVDELLDRCLEYNLALLEQLDVAATGIDGLHSGEDWGSQHGTLMGARTWRRFIKPRVREMYAAAHRKGLPVFIHTCGDIAELFPDLIEIGVTVVNPIQPEVMDVEWLKREYGRDIALYGGVGSQSVMPLGSPAEVIAQSRRRLEILGKGGGYIFGNAGAFPTETPLENLLALIDVAQNQERKHGN
ncbi:MAG: hypothetical protein HYY04_11980 [Chloroflexi bacterium]|nr:hypothetical protein [Chloroflexota bacterium]